MEKDPRQQKIIEDARQLTNNLRGRVWVEGKNIEL